MERPSFTDIYMQLAINMAKRSTCRRLQVGCAIVTPDFRKVLAVGYNGNAAGCANDCDNIGDLSVGNCGCLHAEDNAVINCDAPRQTQKIVFVTHLPCIMCAKRLINLGNVLHINYANEYRSDESKKLLEGVGIDVSLYNGVK